MERKDKKRGEGMNEVQRQMTEKTHKSKKNYTRKRKHKGNEDSNT